MAGTSPAMTSFGGRITSNHTRNYFGCGTIRIYGFGDFQPCG
ncbi:MAG: hypothetical protein QOJ15_6071 [Bradyrhizobium sp.]|jgi:hypothetical protein|nr:hypothetical protein [Bradyrhizobium sp.]